MLFASFLDKLFRPSPFFRLRERSELSGEEQQLLLERYDSDELYGAFQRKSSHGVNKKIAHRELAFLYLHLQQSDRIPFCLLSGDREQLTASVSRLVLDGIIEIEGESGFVSGQSAIPVLFISGLVSVIENPTSVSLLSLEAMRYAYRLNGLSEGELAERLYTYNTAPIESLLINTAATITDTTLLFADAPLSVHQALAQNWYYSPPFSGYDWHSWHREQQLVFLEGQPVYKLYISPIADQLPAVFQLAALVLIESEAFGCKVGAGAAGLVRPDKMVVYFETKKGLLDAAAKLEQRLFGVVAQGVPFTAELVGDGLLSWGVDPAAEGPAASSGESWRIMVTKQIAQAMLDAQHRNLPWDEALPFILARLLTDGIDAKNWSPAQAVEVVSMQQTI